MAAPKGNKAGRDRVLVLAGSLSVKSKTGGKETQVIILRPTRRVAEKLNLPVMNKEEIDKYANLISKDGRRVVIRGRWRGGTEVIVPDPAGKDEPPFQLRKKGSKFLRFRVPSGFTAADVATVLEKGGKANFFSMGGTAFYSLTFAKKLKAKNLKGGAKAATGK